MFCKPDEHEEVILTIDKNHLLPANADFKRIDFMYSQCSKCGIIFEMTIEQYFEKWPPPPDPPKPFTWAGTQDEFILANFAWLRTYANYRLSREDKQIEFQAFQRVSNGTF